MQCSINKNWTCNCGRQVHEHEHECDFKKHEDFITPLAHIICIYPDGHSKRIINLFCRKLVKLKSSDIYFILKGWNL